MDDFVIKIKSCQEHHVRLCAYSFSFLKSELKI